MKSVYINSGIPEKEAKKRFCFPENIMMENAAAALEREVLFYASKTVLILCGTGNNGGDGYALSRRIFGKVQNLFVVAFGEPKTEEAILQRKMSLSVGVKISNAMEWFAGLGKTLEFSDSDVIVDCVYGTGFHGELPEDVKVALDWCNVQNVVRIACDVPSGMKFIANKTVTMGALKKNLYEDSAKDFVGEIIVADLGISSSVFESCAEPDAYIIEENDIKLPVRTKKSVHKGNFGHVCIVLGEKTGAGIIAGTAALRFGSGLVSVLKNEFAVQNFAMSPELMIAEDFPEKTSAVLVGSGLGRSEKAEKSVQKVVDFICKMENPAAVLDADFFYSKNLNSILEKLNSLKNARVILTPHPKELCELVNSLNLKIEEHKFSEKKQKSQNEEKFFQEKILLSEVVKNRFEFAAEFSKRFPNLTLIAKGANTYIFSEKSVFICDKGTNSLAKAGSGDVLAGLCVSLLGQGYSAKDSALTAVFEHAVASAKFEYNFECTPLNLIERF